MQSYSANFKAKDYSLYAYINTSKNEPNVSNYFETMRQFNDYAGKVNDNLVKLAIIDVILLAASFVIAFYYFKIVGKKDDDSPAKLIFIDYIPLLLQLGIVGGSGFGLVALLISAFDEYYDITLLLAILQEFALAVGCFFLSFAVLLQGILKAERNFTSICFFIGSALHFSIFSNL